MTNEKETLEIKKKSQQVTEEELSKVAGGKLMQDCGTSHKEQYESSCRRCNK